jgi:hypothetical protein
MLMIHGARAALGEPAASRIQEAFGSENCGNGDMQMLQR